MQYEDPPQQRKKAKRSGDRYKRLEVVLRECLQTDQLRLVRDIIREEGRMHSSRKYAEQAGLACIRGLNVAFDGVRFVAKQNRRKTAWRIQSFVVRPV